VLRTLVLRQRRKTRLMRNLTPLRGYKTIFNRFNKFQYHAICNAPVGAMKRRLCLLLNEHQYESTAVRK
jgi:hypothetical protein